MKSKLSTIRIVCIAIIALFVSEMNAQSKKERPEKRPTFSELLEKMDANEDGKLSKDEVEGPLKNNFSKIDTNEDGFITKEELEKAPKPDGKRPPKKD